MLTAEQGQHFAERWIEAWNRHDLDAILAHYHPEVEFISPFVIRLLDRPDGALHGVEALRDYFARGLSAYPDLHFQLHSVLLGVGSVTLHYRSVNNLSAAEVMELDEEGRVTRVLAHYR